MARQRITMESFHGETADGEGAIPWQGSEWIAMEYSHGETARDSGVHQ
jgi:hypothetical protein